MENLDLNVLAFAIATGTPPSVVYAIKLMDLALVNQDILEVYAEEVRICFSFQNNE